MSRAASRSQGAPGQRLPALRLPPRPRSMAIRIICRSTRPVRGAPPIPGCSKLQIEGILEDLAVSDPAWSIALLRYFNPVGAHASGADRRDPTGVPNNLMPFIAQVAVGRRAALNVFGQDPTPDGTGVRLYPCERSRPRPSRGGRLDRAGARGTVPFNLPGPGAAARCSELVRAFEAASGRGDPARHGAAPAGDVAACWADPAKAASELGWTAALDIAAMCRDTWHCSRRTRRAIRPRRERASAGSPSLRPLLRLPDRSSCLSECLRRPMSAGARGPTAGQWRGRRGIAPGLRMACPETGQGPDGQGVVAPAAGGAAESRGRRRSRAEVASFWRAVSAWGRGLLPRRRRAPGDEPRRPPRSGRAPGPRRDGTAPAHCRAAPHAGAR